MISVSLSHRLFNWYMMIVVFPYFLSCIHFCIIILFSFRCSSGVGRVGGGKRWVTRVGVSHSHAFGTFSSVICVPPPHRYSVRQWPTRNPGAHPAIRSASAEPEQSYYFQKLIYLFDFARRKYYCQTYNKYLVETDTELS